jgi:hypothetical protein
MWAVAGASAWMLRDVGGTAVVEHGDTSLFKVGNRAWVKVRGHLGAVNETSIERVSETIVEELPPALSAKAGGAIPTSPENPSSRPSAAKNQDQPPETPTMRSYSVAVRLDNADHRLSVAITAPREIRPATSFYTAIRVTDSAGAPVANAAVTGAAVDEGICRLTNFATPDPFNFFTGVRALAVATADLYGQLMPEVAKPDKTSTPGGDGDCSKTGRIGESGASESMLVFTSSSFESRKKSGLSFTIVSRVSIIVAGNVISLLASHLVVLLEKLLP